MALFGFNRKLNWTDFTEVTTPRVKGMDSATHSGFAINYSWNRTRNGTFVIIPSSFQVTVRMDSGKSWIVRGKATNGLLLHEQGHYDITAIAARQFHDDALKIEATTERELRATLDSLFKNTFTLMGQLQDIYDDPVGATNHSMNATMQLGWTLSIWKVKNNPNSRLDTLASFLHPTMPVLIQVMRLDTRGP
jgi:hypothetical protein